MLNHSLLKTMDPYIIPNLRNACRVLSELSSSPEPLTVSDCARRLDVPRTSMLRILHTLEVEGLVEKSARGYTAGAQLLRTGLAALRQDNLRVLARPVLDRLSRELGETAHLAKRAGGQVLILIVSESPNTVRAASQAGKLVDIHCSATGKVLLAHLADDPMSLLGQPPWTQRTENTITTPDAMLAELELTRERGYGIDDIEYVVGVRCLAAPVYGPLGEVVAAIGITASITSFTRDRIAQVGGVVIAAAKDLSNALNIDQP